MESAKKLFEAEREKILSELPESIKAMFGTIGFAAAEFDENDMIPVLVMSPYDVPPKPVRDVYWFDYFSKAKRSKTLDKLSYLVYHYGADDPDDCYSFIEHDDFISYEEGKARGYDVLPADLALKLQQQQSEENIELTEEEVRRVRGLRELNEDVLKDPIERKRGTIDFKERHELLPPSSKSKALKSPPAAKRQKK